VPVGAVPPVLVLLFNKLRKNCFTAISLSLILGMSFELIFLPAEVFILVSAAAACADEEEDASTVEGEAPPTKPLDDAEAAPDELGDG